MSYKKIQNFLNKDPINKISDGSTTYTIGTLSDSGILYRSGTNLSTITSGSIAPSVYISSYDVDNSDGTSPGAGVWAKLSSSNTMTDAYASSDMSGSGDNRITYKGTSSKKCFVMGNATVSIATGQLNLYAIDLALARNGVIQSASLASVNLSGSIVSGSANVSTIVQFTGSGDYVEIWGRTNAVSEATGFTGSHISLNAIAIPE